MDLVLVIDISGSMQGSKLDLVKDTLRFLVQELKEFDRLSLLVFDDRYEVLSHLCPMTENNKTLYLKIIDSIVTRGSTNIKDPLQKSLDMLLNREFINDTSAILLLSDG